jgi:hypothetical protein
MQRWDKVNERQLAILKRIAAGEDLTGEANIPARWQIAAAEVTKVRLQRPLEAGWDPEGLEITYDDAQTRADVHQPA